MLIDTWPTDAGSTVVRYQKSQGVSDLDVVVITHPHEDHIGGMDNVLNAIPEKLYIDNGETTIPKTYKNIMSTLQLKQIPYAVVTTGKSIPFGYRITVNVLNPSSQAGDLNEDSIALKVTNGSKKFLFLGASFKVFGDWSAQILKITHHVLNSGSSLACLSQVNQEVPIMEVRPGNMHGDPISKTLSNLETAGAKIYPADLNGNSVIKSDGSTYTVGTNKGSSPMSFRESKTVATIVSTPQPTPVKTAAPAYVAPVLVTRPVYSPPASSSSGGMCDCPRNRYNCGGFPLPNIMSGQYCYNYGKLQGKGDVYKLYRDKDGLVCES